MGFWDDSTNTSEIYIPLESEVSGYYSGSMDGVPGTSFSYFVIFDGLPVSNCVKKSLSHWIPSLNEDDPCSVNNNINFIEPFNCVEVTDCNGNQDVEGQWANQIPYLIGDGNCDSEDGWFFNFNCDEFDLEGGDCLDFTDCEEQGLSYFAAGRGLYPEEVMWNLLDCEDSLIAQSGAPFASCIDLPENIIIKMWDSYGDGWQGNQLTINNNESYTLITKLEYAQNTWRLRNT